MYLRFQGGKPITDGGKKFKCCFVNAEIWVGFGAQEFKEEKRLLMR